MTDPEYDSKGLQEYRLKAAQLGDLRKEVGDTVGRLTPAEAQREFEKLTASTKELKELRQQLPPKERFLVEFGVQVFNDHTVSFVLPFGASKLDIISRAQALLPGWRLADSDWAVDEKFTAVATKSERFIIDGHVDGLDSMTSDDQKAQLAARGLQMARLEDLAAAICVSLVSTGGLLLGEFKWTGSAESNRTRTIGGFLELNNRGLISFEPSDGDDRLGISTAARLPISPNV